jgi:starvation-inducible DNA-binding protein
MIAADEKMFTTHIDIKEGTRKKVIGLLNQHLADTLVLYSHAKQAHWNVKGSDFYSLHQLFDALAEVVEKYIDTIAERVTALGGTAMGTVSLAADATNIPEYPLDVVDGMQHVEVLIEHFASYAASTREAIDKTEEWDDMATNDLFNEIARDIDKGLWFLEAHIQTEK